VVKALRATLLTNISTGDRTENTEAYTLLLKGRFLNERGSEVDLRRAPEVLNRALTLDQDYVPAWLELAKAYEAAFRTWKNTS